jgi:peptidoglycan/xylan/chitin deacetylase (PgdA/CDA1 family)
VREGDLTRVPNLRVLGRAAFEGQIEHLGRHHTFVSLDDCFRFVDDGRPLPAGALLLTFDDGYLDHFVNVAPVLDRLGISGAFFPVVQSSRDRRLLDVNKIQLVLDAQPDVEVLVRDAQQFVTRGGDGLRPWSEYVDAHAVANRFDDGSTRLVKNLLQKALPVEVRTRLLDELFHRYVAVDEAVLAEELYMRSDHLRSLLRNGHNIGSHGVAHVWFDGASDAELTHELEGSRAFLDEIDVPINRRALCYPYGGVDDRVVAAAQDAGYRLGFTVREGRADLAQDRMRLPRLDTNSFPTVPDETPSPWTASAGSTRAAPRT